MMSNSLPCHCEESASGGRQSNLKKKDCFAKNARNDTALYLFRSLFVISLMIFLASCTTVDLSDLTDDDLKASEDQNASSNAPDEETIKKFHEAVIQQRRDNGYYTDVKKQSLGSLQGQLSIDEAYKETKKIPSPNTKPPERKALYENQKVMTDREIVRSLLNDDVRNKKIDLDFEEIKLGDIFMTLGKASGINIVLDPAFKALTTDIHLKQVSIEEAIILMANSFNLGLKIVEDSLFVTAKDKLKEENLVSKVIKLRNIKAKDAKVMIENLAENVSVGEDINTLIVRADPDQMVKIDRLIEIIDLPQPQVILEAKIIEINKDALRDLGVDWSDQIVLSYQEGQRDTKIPSNANPVSSLYHVGRFERTPLQFSTIIKILEQQNKAKLLATPRISTINEKEAEIFVGDRVPYTVTTISGGVATTDVRFVEPGIRLRITPSIIEDNFVVIKVEPEVSFIFAFRGEHNDIPQVRTREATAYLRVRNQDTVVLGGILSQEDKQNLAKVPFLGDVPIIGNIFTYEKRTVTDTELIITITPTIIHGEI